MKDLDDVGVLEDRGERREILDEDGVDRGDVAAGVDLDEAKAREVGLLAEKLGIDGDDAAGGDLVAVGLELFLGGKIHASSILTIN